MSGQRRGLPVVLASNAVGGVEAWAAVGRGGVGGSGAGRRGRQWRGGVGGQLGDSMVRAWAVFCVVTGVL